MGEEKNEPEIKVTDRRRFSAEGEPLEGPDDAAPPPEATAGPVEPPPRERPPLPPASFEFLIISLRWQAEMQLGVFGGGEEQEEPANDLEGARHAIDLLAILQEKTKGNLSWEEQRLLENTLTELRFRYVQVAGAAKKL